MSDRELLELAAKAADLGRTGIGNDGFGYYPNGPHDFTPWNPLEDDGDALRLAVKLQMDIAFMNGFNEVNAWPDIPSAIVEEYGDDMQAATRRAIVRAAAEIGRSMP